MLDFVVWPETMVANRNQLAKPLKKDILDKLFVKQIVDQNYKPFGDGHSALKIIKAMEDNWQGGKIS